MAEKGKYEYIGPDGALVNNAIENDRNAKGEHSLFLERSLANPDTTVRGQFTAQEIVKRIGKLEARKDEGRY